jgi:predicted esterase
MSADPHAGQPVLTSGRRLGEGRSAMIMVHGRGAGPANILELAPALHHPEFTYLAPAAAGGTWYPESFMAETEKNEPGVTSGLAAIDRLVDEVVGRGIPRSRIVLLGFSQGACLASTYAVRHATQFGGVIVYSGGLIGPPGTFWEFEGDFDGTPVFLGCSDVDAHVPAARVRQSAEVFRRSGAEVTERIYPGMGHLVNEDEIEFARGLLSSVAGVA